MRCIVFCFAVMLPASWASSGAEHLATAVNVISGITAEEEYCLSVQGDGIMGSGMVFGDGAAYRV